MKYAEILFQQTVGEADTLTYAIPESLNPTYGQLVSVKIRNQNKTGIIWKIHNNKPTFKTRDIEKILEEKPLLSEQQIKLAEWISKYYFTPLFKVAKLFIPKRIFENKPIRERKKSEQESSTIGEKQTAIKLTPDQKECINFLFKDSKLNTFLIHGITGSGKTEIYAQVAQKFIKKEQQVLIMVPEISLTPQIVEYFEKAIGLKAVTIHSKLSEGERYRAWESIWNNEAKLVIGSRSSIFAPFQNLGTIIIDEEHENSYKQDSSPRYGTHAVAEKMQKFAQVSKSSLKIIYGSATPSVETAERLNKQTFNLTERIGESVLPDIEIVDLRAEYHNQNTSIFSEKLQDAIKKALKNKEQIILFLNRRGSASSIVCRDCGHSTECKDCEMKLTYHAKTLGSPSLICHHCGKISTPPTICPNCKGVNIKFLGIGTQKIEAELAKEFPTAKVLRADKDTTSTKHGFKDIYKAFKKHEADILVGTQMIAKGLHLPNVSLVGVVLADIGLNIPDFQTLERNFQLMTQVSGRAGRSSTRGKVIIQTYNPDNLALTHCKDQNYKEFFKYERTQRKLLFNPPFGHLAKLQIEGTTLEKCRQKTENIENLLWRIARENKTAENLEINFYPSYIPRLRNKYRYIILIKSRTENEIISTLLEKLPKEYIMDAEVKIDRDPITTT